jgi:hypothetical protein
LFPHRLDVAAQSGEVHVGALLHLGDGRLLDTQDLGQHLLGQAARLTQFVERHLGKHGWCSDFSGKLGVRRYLRPQICKFLSHRSALPF